MILSQSSLLTRCEVCGTEKKKSTNHTKCLTLYTLVIERDGLPCKVGICCHCVEALDKVLQMGDLGGVHKHTG